MKKHFLAAMCFAMLTVFLWGCGKESAESEVPSAGRETKLRLPAARRGREAGNCRKGMCCPPVLRMPEERQECTMPVWQAVQYIILPMFMIRRRNPM